MTAVEGEEYLKLLRLAHFFGISEDMRSPQHLFSELDLYVLLAILRLGSDAYGVSISQEICEAQLRRVSTSAIYSALDRLSEQGFVDFKLGEATPERGGRAKRFFHVTEEGVAALYEAKATLGQLWRYLPTRKGTA